MKKIPWYDWLMLILVLTGICVFAGWKASQIKPEPSIRFRKHTRPHRVVLQTQAVYVTTLLRNFYRVEQRYATRTI
jgi:hypothetical protein